MTPITRRRLQHFSANRRGFWSLWIFLILFFISLFAEGVANDKPLMVFFEERVIFPVFETIPETEYGGEFATEAEYRDDFVRDLIEQKGKIYCHLFLTATIQSTIICRLPHLLVLLRKTGWGLMTRDVMW